MWLNFCSELWLSQQEKTTVILHWISPDLFLFLGVLCDEPADIPNGSKTPPNGPYRCGRDVIYRCDTGYEPEGETTLICTENGQFNAEAPSCIEKGSSRQMCWCHLSFCGKQSFSVHSKSDTCCWRIFPHFMWLFSACDPPEEIPNASMIEEGSSFAYICNNCYEIEGGGSGVISCMAGEWSEIPTCASKFLSIIVTKSQKRTTTFHTNCWRRFTHFSSHCHLLQE